MRTWGFQEWRAAAYHPWPAGPREAPLSTAAALGLVLLAVVVVNLVARALRSRRREAAARLDGGESAVRRQDGVSARIFTDRTLPGGPKAGGYSQGPASLVLAPERLIVATEWGRVLEVSAAHPGELRWTGPGRLVLEGEHPSGRARVRLELVLPTVDAWLDACRALPGATVVRPRR